MAGHGEPVRFHPGLEHQDAEAEAKVSAEIAETMLGISRKTFEDGGHRLRSVHAKSSAFLKGTLEILPDLPPAYAQGLFARPGRHPVVLRFSSVPGDILPDSISTPRGLAVKVLGVEGERLSGSDGVQDFVLVNGPAFSAPSPEAFLASLKVLAATTDRVEGLKRAASVVTSLAEKAIEAFGGESALLKTLGGEPQNHPAGETYYSQTPLRWGDYVGKVSVSPFSADLRELAGAPVDIGDDRDGMRRVMGDRFSSRGGVWDLRVQLCTDLDRMPIEDASVVWPEDESSHVRVALISVEPQPAWTPERAAEIDDGMAFSPWHGLAAHRPLGAVNRARRVAYPRSAEFRMGKEAPSDAP